MKVEKSTYLIWFSYCPDLGFGTNFSSKVQRKVVQKRIQRCIEATDKSPFDQIIDGIIKVFITFVQFLPVRVLPVKINKILNMIC